MKKIRKIAATYCLVHLAALIMALNYQIFVFPSSFMSIGNFKRLDSHGNPEHQFFVGGVPARNRK